MTESMHVEGIVLKAVPFKEYDKIITLFTLQEGLLSLFVRGSKRTSLQVAALTTPLTAAEYLYSPGKSSLGRFQEGSLLNQHFQLRESLSFLEAADQLSKAICASQWPGKPAPHLYFLFRTFLEKLPSTSSPSSLVASFFLKILKHDGVLQDHSFCSLCQSPLHDGFRIGGERFCRTDAPSEALFFSSAEEKSLSFLTHSRSLATLASFGVDNDFFKKLSLLFYQAIDC